MGKPHTMTHGRVHLSVFGSKLNSPTVLRGIVRAPSGSHRQGSRPVGGLGVIEKGYNVLLYLAK